MSHQVSVVHEGAEGARRIAEAMVRIGDAPPTTIGGAEVREVTDFRTGAMSRPPWLGEHDLVAFAIDEGRVMIRPSGTEPKCKVYVDVRAAVPTRARSTELAALESDLRARAAELAAALVEAAGL